MSIKNRYEFMYFVECVNGNPNGDPDMGNSPRIDPQDMHGLISDVAVKRRIRNYVSSAYIKAGMNMVVQNATNINKFIADAHEKSGADKKEKTKDKVDAAREYMCKNYYDVRTFGAVLSTGANAGQVRGPVQFTFLRSIDPVYSMDISITRMSVTDKVKEKASFAEIEKWESEQDADKLRTMGRKQLIPYGLYAGRGFVSANLSEDTGFGEDDLEILWEAILQMYEHDRSASKGLMSVPALVIFRHTGTDSNEEQRTRQAKLGCAPAHKLFELISVEKKDEIEYPRSLQDYEFRIDLESVPKGVDVGFVTSGAEGINTEWNEVSEDNIFKLFSRNNNHG